MVKEIDDPFGKDQEKLRSARNQIRILIQGLL